MKTTRFTILCLCALLGMSILGCGQKGVTTIKGTVANDSIAALPGVVVELIDANTDEVVESSALKDGKFTLEVASTLEKLYVVQLVYPGSNPRSNAYRTIVIPDISKVRVTLSESSIATGSPITSSYMEFTDKLIEMLAGNDITRIAEHCRETYENNLNNFLGVQALGLLAQFDDKLKLEELEELFNKGGDCVKNDEQLKSTLEDLRNAADTETGNPYKEIEGKLADGTPAKLSDYVGKGYVLVDFWASWCGPCMASVPELKELYAELHKKGLEIVGINVWEQDAEAGPACAKEKGMNWPILYTQDLQNSVSGNRHNVATDTYGVSGIPTTLLIGPDGVIRERFTGIPDNFKEVVTGYFNQ